MILGIAGLAPGVAINGGFVDATNASALYVVLPIGAVFLGMFLLSKVLEKETAAYDREQAAALAAADAAAGRGPQSAAGERLASARR